MTENQKKLIDALEEMFQFDQADLDFGIYRIMGMKRDEVRTFLNTELPDQITKGLHELALTNSEAELSELNKQIEDTKKSSLSDAIKLAALQEFEEKKKILIREIDINSVEADVYNHLTNFFTRYYDNGDFISQRRYKEGVYAIPYEGEEVKLYWANADQYYVKTSEYFKDYTFKTPSGEVIHFKVVEAIVDKDNNKSDEKRFFQLHTAKPFEIIDDELYIYIEYKNGGKKNQKECNIEIVEAFSAVASSEYIKFGIIVNNIVEGKTLLEKQLNQYTARNTFDYFIHKDLEKFLNLELDFYIKNEVVFLDDIDDQSEIKIKEYLTKAKVIRRIAKKVIKLLSQIENFQKMLFLKKKFIVETNYCITLDRISSEFYDEIVENEQQRNEWVELFAIDKIKGDLVSTAYSVPLTKEFLKENQSLVLDTAFFSKEFKEKLIGDIDELDEHIDGLMIHSENFQALNLLQEKYKEKVRCIYIDPPYNTGGDDFIYKDNYQESSWLSCINDRIVMAKPFFEDGGTIAVSIDLKELDKIIALLDYHLGANNRRANISIRRASISGAKVINPGPVNISENIIIYSNNQGDWQPQIAYREKGYDSRYGTIIVNPDEHYSKWTFSTVLEEFAKHSGVKKSQLKRHYGDMYEEKLLEFVINNANGIIQLASLDENSVSAEAVDFKKQSLKKPNEIIRMERDNANDYYMVNGKLILFYKDRLKWVGDKYVPVEPISDIWDDVLPNDLHNEGGVKLKKGKKPEKLINRIFEATTKEGATILDFFAGSATSGAVALKSNRKFINIEASEYFKSIPLQRIKNTLYGDKSGVTKLYDWKGGGIVKYLSLESYEDALNNIKLDSQKIDLLGIIGEEYMLSYMLDIESKDSNSLLNIQQLSKPFSYAMNITRNLESRERNIDIVETFNYLIGLKVERSYALSSFDAEFEQGEYGVITAKLKDGNTYKIKMVEGKTQDNESILIIWRELTGDTLKDNAVLDAFFNKKKISTTDFKYKKIYVNGDNNIQNICSDEEGWKVILIEEEMKKRMFENIN